MNFREKIRIAIDAYGSGIEELDTAVDFCVQAFKELLPKKEQIVPAHDCGGPEDCLWCHAQVCYEQALDAVLRKLEP